jgi:hypothetical protein
MNGGGAGTTADSWLRPFEGECKLHHAESDYPGNK